MNHEHFMQQAISKTREGIAKGQSPFGACIVKNGEIISCEHNIVWASTDITAHAEIHALRSASKQLHSIDLSGCTMYSTCEPCPMCFAACHWARIKEIVYGASIADAQQAGFHELTIACDTMKELGKSDVVVMKNILRDDCLLLFQEWSHAGGKAY